MIPLREVVRGVSMQLTPFLQSSVLRTVCGLKGAEDVRVALPCVSVRHPLAGLRSYSQSNSQQQPMVPSAFLPGSGCHSVPLQSYDRFCSPHSIFLSACSLQCLRDFLSDPCSMAELSRRGTCCAGSPRSVLQLSPAARQSQCLPVGQSRDPSADPSPTTLGQSCWQWCKSTPSLSSCLLPVEHS